MLFKSSTMQALERQLADYKEAYEREAQTNLKLMEERNQLLAEIEKLKADGNTVAALSEKLAHVQQQLAESQLELEQTQKICELQAYESKMRDNSGEIATQNSVSPMDEMLECIAQLEAQSRVLTGETTSESKDDKMSLEVQPSTTVVEQGSDGGEMPVVGKKPMTSVQTMDIKPYMQDSNIGDALSPLMQPCMAGPSDADVQPLVQAVSLQSSVYTEVLQPSALEPPVIPELTAEDMQMLDDSISAMLSLQNDNSDRMEHVV